MGSKSILQRITKLHSLSLLKDLRTYDSKLLSYSKKNVELFFKIELEYMLLGQTWDFFWVFAKTNPQLDFNPKLILKLESNAKLT